ncbi:MAG: hypothetical protein HWE11_00775 [Gammaproteobacteria bacterium]|nr:hypothetical protein [Gammaproteobacteria bacterium]
MAKVVALSTTKRKKLKAQRRKRTTLCAHQHHRWEVIKETEFDSKQGRLVTRYRCQRCGAERVGTE